MSTNAQTKQVNLAEMSDEEISNLDYTTLSADSDDTKGSAQPATDTVTTEEHADGTDGAASADAAEDAGDGGAGSTSTDGTDDVGNEPTGAAQQPETTTSYQEEDKGQPVTATKEAQPVQLDPKEELAKIFAPFKAAKREVKVDTVDDVRKLMQMGVDYARKMADLKPYMRALKTLEANGLLSEQKINFLIDLDKKNPEAVKKFLKDSELDPRELAYEDDTKVYNPTNHMLGDKEIQLNEVLDEIRETESFSRTVDIITKQWDQRSKQVLMDNPEVIRIINDHMTSGIFDQIHAVVENERLLGRIPPDLSNLDAYKAVGDAMHKAGAFNAPHATSATGRPNQGLSQDSDIKDRKRAASPTRGNATAGKPKIDIGKLTDEQIMKLDPATL
jgi:hypothetical protein